MQSADLEIKNRKIKPFFVSRSTKRNTVSLRAERSNLRRHGEIAATCFAGLAMTGGTLHAIAIASISIFTSLGSLATSTVARAGLDPLK